ncbi:MAG: exopolysaccharide Pel transporter PelG [bacterium]
MAGIGFVLRKLSRQDNLIGTAQAYVISALISTGPWLFTILALGSVSAISGKFVAPGVLVEFRTIIIYNFAFSLVLAAPIYMVVTRYLADNIYQQDVSDTPGLLVGSLLLLFGIEVPLVCLFYLVYAVLPLGLALAAIFNFLLISGIWLISIFLTALKNYRSVTRAFGLGMLITVFGSVPLSTIFGAAGIINSFSLGLSFILALLFARILSEYPYPFKKPFAFLHYFIKYWDIGLSGFVYNAAIWVDKWIMWFAPEADHPQSRLVTFSNYDSAMFLAYLTVVPSMAMFIMSVETSFYEHYVKFYRDIQKMATYRQIQENWRQILSSLMGSARGFVVLQGSICVIVILTSAKIFDFLKINFLQLGIFRFGVLGTLFQVFSLFTLIVLSYFDHRKGVLAIQTVFLVTNAGFTLICLKLGFRFYGYGYFLASLVTFVCAAFITMRYVNQLVYHTFITRNESVVE